MGKKLALMKPCKTAKFWMFSKFDETWHKCWSRPKNLFGKFAKRNNKLQVCIKRKQICFNKTVQNKKGKAIAVYNTFDALQLLDDAEDTPRSHILRPETEIQTLHHVLTSVWRHQRSRYSRFSVCSNRLRFLSRQIWYMHAPSKAR